MICETCGEPLPPGVRVCPWCETPVRPALRDAASPRAPGAPPCQTVDIEAGLPTVDEALAKFDRALFLARQNGTPLLRVVHGWGSSTGGGSFIRPALRRHLAALAERRAIRSFLPGDRYSHALPDGLSLLRRHPVLRLTERTDRLNPGITFVEP